MATTADYWPLIERTRPRRGLLGPRDPDELHELHAARLAKALSGLSPEEIVAFKVWLEDKMDRANRWDLWHAAYLLMGGCSDDMFEYFHAWLISRGRPAFERVLENPYNLADLRLREPEMECEFESLLYVPAGAYERATGKEIWDELPERAGPHELVGEPIDESALEDELPKRFPRIAARWG